jgi:hypothetical protein
MSAPKRSRLRRWTWRLVVAAVVLRVLLALFLVPLLGFFAGFAGLRLELGSASLSLLGASLRLEQVAVHAADAPTAPPLLLAKALAVDLAAFELLRGRVVVDDAELAGAELQLRREADGALRLPRAWLEPAAVHIAAPPSAPAAATTPVRFDLPFALASVRLHDVRLRFDDRVPGQARLYEGTVDVRVRDVGVDDRTGEVAVRLHSPRWFDDAWVTLTTKATPTALDLQLDGALTGVRPAGLPLPPDVAAAFADVRTVAVTLHGTGTGATVPATPRQPALAFGLQLEVLADEQSRARLEASLGPSRAVADTVELPLQVTFSAPELLRSLSLRDAALTLGGAGTAVRGSLDVAGLRPVRLLPALAARGLAWPAAGLDAALRFDAELGDAITAELADVQLAGGDERFALAAVRVRDLRHGPDGINLAEVALDGPQLSLLRTEDGALGLAGLRFRAPTPAVPEGPGATAAPFVAPSWPRLRIGHASWRGALLQFTDASMSPPATLALGDTRLQLDALTLGAVAPPGRFVLSTSLTDAIGALRLEAELTPSEDLLRSTLQLTGDGITARALTPWLAAAGLAPTLQDGSLRLLAEASVQCTPTGMLVRTNVSNVALVDGEQPLLRVRSLRGDGLRLDAEGLDLGDWRLGEPFVAFVQNDDATLALLGLCTLPSPAPPSGPVTTTSPAPTPTIPAGNANAPTAPGPNPPSLRHGALAIERGSVQLRMPGRSEPLQLQFDTSVGRSADVGASLPVTATVQVAGIVRTLRLRADIAPGPSWRVRGEVDAEGLRGDELAGLLPADVRCTLHDGAFHATIEAMAMPSGDGASDDGLRCELGAVRLLDRGEELFALDQLTLPMPSLGRDRVHLGQLAARGLRGLCTVTDDGTHVAGLLLLAPSAGGSAPPAPTPTPAEPAGVAAAPTPAPPAPTSVRLPLLRLDGASFELERLVVRDRRNVDGEPLMLTGALRAEPFTARLDGPSPLRLQLTAAAAPLCRAFAAELSIEPYAVAPTIDGTLRLAGVAPKRLVAVLPSLAAHMQGTADDLAATATLHARLDLKRRDGRMLDLGRAIAGELSLVDITVVDRSGGGANERTLAKIGEVDVVLRAFDPVTGDLLLRAVHVDDVQLAATRTVDGLELLGLRLAATPPPAAANPPAAKARPTARATPSEFAIDDLQVAGLSIDLRDETTSPPTHLPFADIELELERFTTRGFREPLPWQFRAAIRGGPVALEKRVVRSSLLSGLVGSAGAAVLGRSDQHETEQRPLVDEIRVRGELQLFPAPIGRIVTDITALELPAFRGLAKVAGVELTDGLLDHGSTLVLRGDDGLDLESSTVMTWLSLREPPGGPISTYLRLPAPLDTVLFLLRNDADEQRLPLRVRIAGHAANRGEVAQAAVDALVAVIADAVASAGKRAGGMLTGAIGLGGDNKVPDLTAQWPFAAGDPLPATAGAAALLAVLRADPTLELVLVHELGDGDLARAATLASPPPAAIRATIASLRQRRLELLDQRARLAPAVVAAYDAGKAHEARSSQQQLARLDLELGELERSLDQALGMLGDDSPRQQRRRAAAAAMALGQKRLAAVVAALRQAAPELPAAQIQVRRPRGVPVADLPQGGVVRAMLRRRTAG